MRIVDVTAESHRFAEMDALAVANRRAAAAASVKSAAAARLPHEPTPVELLDAILSGGTRYGYWECSVRQLVGLAIREIDRKAKPKPAVDSAVRLLARCGLKVARYVDYETATPRFGDRCLAVVYRTVAGTLPAGRFDFSSKSIDEILVELPGAVKVRRRVGGKPSWTVLLPLACRTKRFAIENGLNKQGGRDDGHA